MTNANRLALAAYGTLCTAYWAWCLLVDHSAAMVAQAVRSESPNETVAFLVVGFVIFGVLGGVLRLFVRLGTRGTWLICYALACMATIVLVLGSDGFLLSRGFVGWGFLAVMFLSLGGAAHAFLRALFPTYPGPR